MANSNQTKTAQIVILDFGSQYTHLIARRIRQLGVRADILPPKTKATEIKGAKGIILSGGPQSVHDKTAIKYDPKIFSLKVPILGLCYGHQLIVHHHGGKVRPGKTKEYGFANIKVWQDSPLTAGLGKLEKVWMSHGDAVSSLPEGFDAIGGTGDCPVAAFANHSAGLYGLQFHPEVTHTENGLKVLHNFVFKICKSKKDWSTEKYWQQIIAEVKKKVGKRNVFLLVSGGVDSSVCFAILEKILGKKRVFGLHIDSGVMRLNESRQVARDLARAGFDDLHVVKAEDKFLSAVEGIVDPEEKRQRIGRTFLKVKDGIMAEMKLNPKDWVLGQGTIYPDTIESGGTAHADKIKTHHNRVDEVLKLMKMGALVEPLENLYKDEVRVIGKKLGLPASLIGRHPFPGPGLGIRCLCSGGSNGKEKVKNKNKLDRKLQKIAGSKFKANALPLSSVGVQGDNRTYKHPVLLQVKGQGQGSWRQLHDLSARMTNEVKEINRVALLLSPKKVNLSKIKTKKSFLTRDRLDLLRKADDVVTKQVRKMGLYKKIWQFPVILAPLTLKGGETIILRPVESKEVMTVNFHPMPKPKLNKIVSELNKIPGIDMILYDVTNKPPGTLEWE